MLSPSEYAALAAEPVPEIFLSSTTLLLSSVVAMILVSAALWMQNQLAPVEEKLSAHLPVFGLRVGGPLLRLGLAAPIGLGALGGLPRHGTPIWKEPTFLVPDMQISYMPGYEMLCFFCLVTAGLLAIGLWTRIAALMVIVLTLAGGQLFGAVFIYSYAAHFLAPALLLLWIGAGPLSVDWHFGKKQPQIWGRIDFIWPVILLMTGATFVYLSLSIKLAHPTLLIAILQHGKLDQLGIPLPWMALVMTGVELIAGLLLMMGHLVRPIGLFLIGAFTFFSIILGETPLFHANLYALTFMLVVFGTQPAAENLRKMQWRIFHPSLLRSSLD
ncbi:hypothetical protein [Yoonia sp. BS5-3]|uniref:DoxX family protein n=1 Tax=Yoonia phaeophyticola TaxID=3137369 RepID=A0ABZ2V0V6_9RHOB